MSGVSLKRMMGRPEQKPPEQKLREVSDMYEKHFLREMMKAMRSTVHEGGFIQSNQAEKIFKEQLDDQYVEKWGERGGIGLSNMIYDQLMNKFGVMMGIKAPVAKPVGPLTMDEKSNYTAKPFQHPGKKQSVSYKFDVSPNAGPSSEAASASVSADTAALPASAAVKAPWDGVLLGKRNLADDQTMVEIEHDNGLKSQLVFKGGLSKVSTGEKLQAGDTLGFLSPEAKALYWTIESDKDTGPETVSE
ncbi:rod-binding protein [Bdellovibrio bacteriovorus]|uniref:rod-binding protein n=1 Tax=Bdellovibrio bacteriovorus TaxID=959 RepID=UPI0021D232B9|nr:rod-binding protein [Bdellovibrio bacteriovorus]UXR64924.1 rod-binding protein [Bdellovibrio bacteriovorus]